MLNLGIIGCGRVTSLFHLKALGQLNEYNITAVSDINEKRMKQVRNECGAASSYFDYKKLIVDKKVDAISVNTPPALHEEMVLNALKNGKHVICEKPLSQTVEGCQKIKEQKKKTRLSVLPAHNYSFSPCIFMMEQVISEGKIGRISSLDLCFENHLRSYRSQTNFRETFKHGIIEDVLPHILSVTIPLIGIVKSIETVKTWCKFYEVNDNAKLEYIAGYNIPVTARLSWTKLRPRFGVRVEGDRGYIYSDLMLGPYKLEMNIDRKTQTLEEKGLSWYFDLVRFKHPSFVNQYRHFYQVIRKGSLPRITIDDEINIVKAVEEASSYLEL